MHDFYLAYARGAAAMREAYSPLLKSATRANIEAVNYATRRMRAYLELSARLAQSRSPQDVMTAQADFWRDACEHQAESTRRILTAMSGSTPPLSQPPQAPVDAATPFSDPPPANAAPPPKQQQSRQEKSRDYIAFPKPKIVRAPSSPQRGPRAKTTSNRNRLS